jgi:hypothetical protein
MREIADVEKTEKREGDRKEETERILHKLLSVSEETYEMYERRLAYIYTDRQCTQQLRPAPSTQFLHAVLGEQPTNSVIPRMRNT